MNLPKVSILIPTYNRAEFLSICVESALAQDYPNLEVIVSDNASQDNTTQLMQKYGADPRVRYYRNDTNLGVFPNWERLLYEYATGEYGKLLCDDDYLYDKGHIKKAVALMQKNNLNMVLSGSVLEKAEDDGCITNLVYDPEIPEITDTEWWLENGGRKWGQRYLFLNFSSGAVFALAKAKELKIFTPYVYGGDYEALFRFMLDGRIGYLKGHSFSGRYHATNDGSLGSFSRAAQGLEIFERIQSFGRRLAVHPQKLKLFIRRNRVVFINTFLIAKWFRENGVSLRSIRNFKSFLSQIDRTLFPSVITSYPTLCWLLRLKNEKVYSMMRKVFRAF